MIRRGAQRPVTVLGAGLFAAGLLWSGESLAQTERAQGGTWPIQVAVDGVSRCGGGCADNGNVYVRIYIDGEGGAKQDVDYCKEGVGCLSACGTMPGVPLEYGIYAAENDVHRSLDFFSGCGGPVHIRIEQWEQDAGDDDLCLVHASSAESVGEPVGLG